MTAVAAAAAHDFPRGVMAPLQVRHGALVYGEPGRAGSPYPSRAGDQLPRSGFAEMRYPNARPGGYRLADVHVARRGPDGQVWIDGHPDDGSPLQQRCPVASCGQLRTNYPGHLCTQFDGTETWRDWPCGS